MSRKGRRSRSKKVPPRSASVAAIAPDGRPVTLPPAGVPAETSAGSSVDESEPSEQDSSELTVPPVGDLDARFFAESSSEVWLAHELELRDPQFLRKMTADVALRRAHLARYVAGVVAVAVALCFAAVIKSAESGAGGDGVGARSAAQMAMPTADLGPKEPPVSPGGSAATGANGYGVDGGGD